MVPHTGTLQLIQNTTVVLYPNGTLYWYPTVNIKHYHTVTVPHSQAGMHTRLGSQSPPCPELLVAPQYS